MTATILDIAVVVIILLSGALAFTRGLAREVLSIVAWVGAAAATVYIFPLARPFAQSYISVKLIADIVTGVSIFVVVLIVLSVLSHALSHRVRASALGPLDRSLGLSFGLLRGVVVVALAYMLFAWAVPPEDRPDWVVEARTEPFMTKGADALRTLIPDRLVAEGDGAAADAKRTAEQAIEAGRAVAPLAEPLLKAPPAATGAAAGNSGYRDQERKDLERLIQSSQ
jgi:membrane protein required for colicin V production